MRKGEKMQKSLNLVVCVALGGLLAACSNTAEISKMNVKGGAYEKGLHKNYIKLANAEFGEDDWGDAGLFEHRAKMAAMGKPTAPEMLSERDLVSKHRKPLAAAYKRLTKALARGGAKKAGKHAANAQSSFECWMQEAEENLQRKHIDACRNNFYGAMTLLEDAVYTPSPKAAKKVAKKKKKKVRKPQTVKYVLYFDFNSAKLNKSALTAIGFIKGEVKKRTKISVAAFTDRSGSTEYNDNLAIRRATSVLLALKRSGVTNEMRTTIHGEARNAVKTNDGARERLNRRVEISVKQ
jgi:outer membrane protein OmpA-like peptidoglycan-associated protein